MACKTCNGQMIWQGSFSRGKHVCPGCDPKEDTDVHLVYIDGDYKYVSKTLKRYYDEVSSFHRGWCTARKNAQARKAARSRDDECDCGFTAPAKYTHKQIEDMETQHHGKA